MSKRKIPPQTTPRVRLRLLEEPDLPLTLAWRNQDHIRKWFFHSAVITAEQHRAWYERYRERDDDFVFVIEDVEEGRPVGQVALYNVDWPRKRAEFGRLMIGEAQAAGKGLAKEATRRVVDMGFDCLGLEEIFLEVLGENARAIQVYAACGFEVTGREDTTVRMAKTVRRAAKDAA